MKLAGMTLNTVLLFSTLTAFAACNEQIPSKEIANDPPPNIAKGEIVYELADSTIVVFQDKNNNYWFGSNGKGLYRYDGKKIIRFTAKDGLCDDRISKIEDDKSGNIYITTINGISKFDGKSFNTLKPVTGAGWKLVPDDLWFKGAQDSGIVYRYDGTILHRLKFPKSKAGEEYILEHPRSKFPFMNGNPYDVYSIYKDSRGNIWFGTASLGVCRYDGKSFLWISEQELGYGDIAYGVRSTIEDKDGKFWFSNVMHRYDVYQNESGGIEKGAIPFKKEKGIGNPKDVNKDSAKNELIYFMSGIVDSTGAMWMVTFSTGVWRYDGKTIVHYPITKGENPVTLFSIFKDHQGVLWLGTHVDGVYRFNGKSFEKFRP